MHTALAYEAQKLMIEARLGQAQLQHQPPRPSRSRLHSTATSRPLRRGRAHLMVGLFGLAGAVAVGLLAFAGSALAALPSNCRQTQNAVTCTFAYTGVEQVFTVPSGLDSVQVDAVGAAGGAGSDRAGRS